eukprot:scaffold139212_cov38-Tisochrysis_lutea.AAC.1
MAQPAASLLPASGIIVQLSDRAVQSASPAPRSARAHTCEPPASPSNATASITQRAGARIEPHTPQKRGERDGLRAHAARKYKITSKVQERTL